MYQPNYAYLYLLKLRGAWAKRRVNPTKAKRMVGEVICTLHNQDRGVVSDRVYELAKQLYNVLEGGLA